MKIPLLHIFFLASLLLFLVAHKTVIACVICPKTAIQGNYIFFDISFSKLNFQPCIGCTFHKCNHYFPGCTGRITLSSFSHSQHAISYNETSVKTVGKERNKEWHVKVKKKDNDKFIRYDMAEIAGNCCWKVRSRFMGGQLYEPDKPVGTFQPGWAIKKVIFNECQQVCEKDNCGKEQ